MRTITSTSNSNSKAKLGVFLLAATAVAMVGCPTQWQQGHLGDGDSDTAYIAGVFYDFFAIGQDRLVVEKKNKDVAHLYVARFGPDGRARFLRSFEPLADGRAASFVAAKDRVYVAGVLAKDLKIDQFSLTRHQAGRPDIGEALFLGTFDHKGNSTGARVVAGARKMHRAMLRPNGRQLELNVQFEGALSVPGQNVPATGSSLKLLIGLDGKVHKAQVSGGPVQDGTVVAPPAPKGALLRDEDGQQSGWMLASMMMQPGKCDFCSPDMGGSSALYCRNCRNEVCKDSRSYWCCDETWNQSCMRDANTWCAASESECACSHGTGVQGWVMQRFCTTPTAARVSCVQNVASVFGSCADSLNLYTGWDGTCTGATAWRCGGTAP